MGSEFNDIIQIKKVLKNNPTGLSIKELVKEVNLHRNTTAKYLEMLHIKGDVDVKIVGNSKFYYPSKRIPESAILNFCLQPCLIINRRMRIENINNTCLELLSLDRKLTLGKQINDLTCPLLHDPKISCHFQSALKGRAFTEHIQITINGVEYYFLAYLIPTILENRTEGFTIVLNNKTQYKKVLSSLEISEERYMAVVEDQTESICRFLPDKTLTFTNRTFCQNAERTVEELIGTEFEPLVTNRFVEPLKQTMSEISVETPVKSTTVQVLRSDGRIHWEQWDIRGIFENNGVLTEYQAIGRDVTELKNAEDQLELYQENLEVLVKRRTKELQMANTKLLSEISRHKETEKHLKQAISEIKSVKLELNEQTKRLDIALNGAELGVWEMNYTSRIFQLNNRCTEILGESPEDKFVAENEIKKVIHPDEQDSVLKNRQKLIQDQIPYFESEFRIISGKNQWKWVHSRGTVTTRDDTGRPLHITGILHDINKRKQIETQMLLQRDLALTLATSSSPGEAYALCMDAVLKISGMTTGAVYHVGEDNRTLYLICAKDISGNFLKKAPYFDTDTVPAMLVSTGKPVYMGPEELHDVFPGITKHEGFQSGALLPARHNNSVIGCYALFSYDEENIPCYTRPALESIVTFVSSVVAKIRAENTLKKTNIYHRSLIEACPDALAIIDTEGKISDVNTACENITGYAREKIIGTAFSDYFSDPDKASDCCKQAFQKKHLNNYPLEIKHRDGRLIPVIYNVSVCYDEKGAVTGVFASARKKQLPAP